MVLFNVEVGMGIDDMAVHLKVGERTADHSLEGMPLYVLCERHGLD